MNNPNIHVSIHLDSKDKDCVLIEVKTEKLGEMQQEYIVLSLGYNTMLFMTPKQAEQIAKALLSEIQVLTSPEHAE